MNQMFVGSVEETSMEELQSLYDTNVFGVLRVCMAVLPAMRKQGRGTIVNMSSLGGLLAVPYIHFDPSPTPAAGARAPINPGALYCES